MYPPVEVASERSCNASRSGESTKSNWSNGSGKLGNQKAMECNGNKAEQIMEAATSEGTCSSSSTAAATGPAICSSDSNAEQQRDEMEALQAIYSDSELTILRPAPNSKDQPCACYMFTLPEADPNVSSSITSGGPSPVAWKGQLGLKLDMPAGYPEELGAAPKVTVETGKLSMMDFPSVLRKSLTNAVVRRLKIEELF
jgi:hypothetical protein